MKNTRTILNSSGKPLTGYSISLYKYYNQQPYYQGDAITTYIDNGDGTYTADIDVSVKGTLVITKPDGTIWVPEQFIGGYFPGDDIANISPDNATGVPDPQTQEFYPE